MNVKFAEKLGIFLLLGICPGFGGVELLCSRVRESVSLFYWSGHEMFLNHQLFLPESGRENSFPGRLADLNIRMFNLYRIVDCQNCLTFLDLFSLVLFLLSIWQCDQEWNVKFVYR